MFIQANEWNKKKVLMKEVYIIGKILYLLLDEIRNLMRKIKILKKIW